MMTAWCTLASTTEAIPIIAVGGGIAIALLSIMIGGIYKVTRTNQEGRTRREIAAYVAEGSISPDDGERLMRAAGQTDDAKKSC